MDSQVYTFWLALLALREAGSVRLFRSFVEKELELAYKHLLSEEDRDVLKIAESLGLKAISKELKVPVYRDKRDRLHYKIFSYAVSVRDFLKVSARSRESKLKLTNMPVKEGTVYLDGEMLRELVLAMFKVKMFDKLNELEAPETSAFRKLVEELRRAELIAVSGFDKHLLPNCIKEILERAGHGELSDAEIHTLLSFLKRIETPREAVVEMLMTLDMNSDLAETIALALEEVDSPGPLKCEELKKREICDCEKDLTLEYSDRKAQVSQRALEKGR
ncbi:MAG: hypothetical protein QXN05_02185 [Acidilobaceae archaeon]